VIETFFFQVAINLAEGFLGGVPAGHLYLRAGRDERAVGIRCNGTQVQSHNDVVGQQLVPRLEVPRIEDSLDHFDRLRLPTDFFERKGHDVHLI
jgi:hypothetical protein